MLLCHPNFLQYESYTIITIHFKFLMSLCYPNFFFQDPPLTPWDMGQHQKVDIDTNLEEQYKTEK